jgi:hypothetical protein
MKNWIFILCIIMLAASCNRILKFKPSGMLSENEMADVLVDIHLTEATLRLGNDSIARILDTTALRTRFAQVFKKHDVTPDQFNKSLNYYLVHIEELDKIYVEVISRLSQMEIAMIPESTSKTGVYIFKRNRSPLSPTTLKNPWYRSMNKQVQPEEIKYFDSTIYPAAYDK